MNSRIERIRDQIFVLQPESILEPLTSEELWRLRSEYPTLPEHLFDLYQILGLGNIGDSGFMIHRLTKPESIYDPLTADQLSSIRIVGDDFAGWCVGYDIEEDWNFGGIELGKFTKISGFETILDLVESWFLDDKTA